MNPVNRPLRADERALLAFLLSADFPGRHELRTQSETVIVTGECECGCGAIGLHVETGLHAANVEKSIPIEAYADALDVLLFTRDGLSGQSRDRFLCADSGTAVPASRAAHVVGKAAPSSRRCCHRARIMMPAWSGRAVRRREGLPGWCGEVGRQRGVAGGSRDSR
jgi:hypothetical protein